MATSSSRAHPKRRSRCAWNGTAGRPVDAQADARCGAGRSIRWSRAARRWSCVVTGRSFNVGRHEATSIIPSRGEQFQRKGVEADALASRVPRAAPENGWKKGATANTIRVLPPATGLIRGRSAAPKCGAATYTAPAAPVHPGGRAAKSARAWAERAFPPLLAIVS